MPHDSLSLQAAFKYLFIDEIHALKQLAQSLPPNPVVVNIGAGAGTSGLAFMESRRDLQLWTIDIQDASHPFGCLEAEREMIEQAGFGIGDRLYRHRQYLGDSKDWGIKFQQLDRSYKVDLVFIDGDHSYNGCKGDILAWLPNIKSGGIMAVHDFEKRKVFNGQFIEGAPHPLPWPGVDRAVRHYLCPYYEMIFEFIDNYLSYDTNSSDIKVHLDLRNIYSRVKEECNAFSSEWKFFKLDGWENLAINDEIKINER